MFCSELFVLIVQGWTIRRDVHKAADMVDHANLVATGSRRLD
jgi:hypothetical protein